MDKLTAKLLKMYIMDKSNAKKYAINACNPTYYLIISVCAEWTKNPHMYIFVYNFSVLTTRKNKTYLGIKHDGATLDV